MSKVAAISGIGDRARELLEAAGYLDAAALARCDADALLAELGKANDVLGIMRKLPAKSTVQRWLREARLLGQADRIHHAPDVPPAILDRARADAQRIAGPPPANPGEGLVLDIRMEPR